MNNRKTHRMKTSDTPNNLANVSPRATMGSLRYLQVFRPLFLAITFLGFAAAVAASERLESYTNKTVLVFTPHPDDDTFAVGGTMALLAKNKNRVIVVIYTNDN